MSYQMRLVITMRTISEEQPDIKTHQGAATAEHESHETADGSVALDSLAIVNPDQRQVLHVVKHFKQRDAHEHAGHDVIAIPPKRNARDEKHEFHRARPFPAAPHPNKIRQKYC